MNLVDLLRKVLQSEHEQKIIKLKTFLKQRMLMGIVKRTQFVFQLFDNENMYLDTHMIHSVWELKETRQNNQMWVVIIDQK